MNASYTKFAQDKACTVHFFYHEKARLALVRNGKVRHVEPDPAGTDMSYLTDALSKYPEMFFEHQTGPTHLDAIAVQPGRVISGQVDRKPVYAAVSDGDVILNACRDDGDPLNAEELNRLQAMYDEFPGFFSAKPLGAARLRKFTLRPSKACDGKWPSMKILCHKDLVVAACSDTDPELRFDLQHAQTRLHGTLDVIDTRALDAEGALAEFPYLKF